MKTVLNKLNLSFWEIIKPPAMIITLVGRGKITTEMWEDI